MKKINNWGNQPGPRQRRRQGGRRGKGRRKPNCGPMAPLLPNVSSKRVVAAPSFVGTVSVTPRTGERVKKTEFLMDVPLHGNQYKQFSDSEPGFYVMSYSLNPAESNTFKILPGIADNNQQFKLNGVTLTFEAAQGASQQGRGVIFVSTDPTRAEPLSIDQAEQADGAMKIPFISGSSVHFGPNAFNLTPPVKQIKEPDDPNPDSDDPLITAGRLYVCTDGSTVAGTAAVIVGRLLISYDVTLAKQVDGSEQSVKTSFVKWASSTTYHLSMALATHAGHHRAFYDKRDNTVYGSTGPWLVNRNPRVAKIVILTGVNSGAWTTATDLNVVTSETGNSYIDDAAAATQLYQSHTDAGGGIFIYFIPRGTKHIAIHCAYAVVSTIRMFTFPIRKTVSF